MIVYHFSWCILSSKFLLLFWHIWLPASRLLIFIILSVFFMLNICLSFGNFSIYFQHYYFSCLVLLSFFLVWQFNKLFAYWCNFFVLCIFSFLPMAFLLLNWPKFSATPYIHICSQFLFCISYNCNLVCILFFYC